MPPQEHAQPLGPTAASVSSLVRRAHRPVARCLFGPPSPKETRRLAEDAFARDRERFAERWGDVEWERWETPAVAELCGESSTVEKSPDAEGHNYWKDSASDHTAQPKDLCTRPRQVHRNAFSPYSRHSNMKDFFPCCRRVALRAPDASSSTT